MDLVNLKHLEFACMTFIFIGVYLQTKPDIRGWYFMIVAQIGWGIFSVINGFWFLLAQSIFLNIFNVIGIRKWKKKGVGIGE